MLENCLPMNLLNTAVEFNECEINRGWISNIIQCYQFFSKMPQKCATTWNSWVFFIQLFQFYLETKTKAAVPIVCK